MEQIIVTHLDSSTTKLQSKENVSTITRANQKVELLGADTVEISVESATKLNFYIGDKIAVIGRDYTLNTPAKERKLSERKFIYDLVFEGVQYDLLRVSYSVNVDTTSNEIQDLSGDSLTGDLKMFLDVLLSNANRVFLGKWVLGTYPTDTETKTLTFGDSDNCLSVLQSLCSEGNYNTEFSIDIAPNGVRTLNIGATGNVFPYTFQYGKGKGLYELTREKVSSTNIVTRLSVYGSSRNINTSKYRAFRLCLPGKTKGQSYLESATGIASYGVWEQTKNFEEIYPRRTGTISALGDSELKFVDSSMNFDLNETDGNGNTLYLIPGAAAKIHFNTGNLAGYEFEITNYNHTTKTFIIRPFTDENGYTFPSPTNAAFQFAQGDKYVILDIYLPQSYIDAAEAELATQGQEYLDKYSQPNVMYGLTVDPIFLKDVVGAEVEANIVWVGDYIPVKDTDLDVDKSIRVKGFTRDLLKDYVYSLTIADMAVTVSTISRVVSDLRGIDNLVRINNLIDPARARRNYKATTELVGMIETVQAEAALIGNDPAAQFQITGAAIKPNYGGNANALFISASVVYHNYYPIGNPSTWNVAQLSVSGLASSTAYFVYIKASKSAGTGVFYISSTKIAVEEIAGYFHFPFGILSSVVDDVRIFNTTKGYTLISGDSIKTGKITSQDGQTYFDLDSGEIQGKISFKSGSSGYSNLTDKPDLSVFSLQDDVDALTANLQAQIDGQIMTWFYDYVPTLANAPANGWATTEDKDKHLGDLFYNSATGLGYRFSKIGSVYSWEVLKDTDVATALANAAAAQDTADAKKRVFLVTPTTPYEVGDLWTQGDSGDLMRCKTTRLTGSYTAADWEKAVKYTDDTAVNELEIGGRNLLLGSEARSGGRWSPSAAQTTFTADVVDGNACQRVTFAESSGFSALSLYQSYNPTQVTDLLWAGRTLVASVQLRADVSANFTNLRLVIRWEEGGTQYHYTYSGAFSIVAGQWKTIHVKVPDFPFHLSDKTSVNVFFVLESSENWVGRTLWIRRNMLSFSTTPTDWTPAPEDVQAGIDAASTAAANAQSTADTAATNVSNLNTYVDGAFKDGVIETSEAKAIEKYINSVNESWTDFESTYNVLYANSYLEGTPKTNLLNAKVSLAGAKTNLLGSINTAIADGKTTAAEKADVDSKFTAFNSAVASFKTAVENANKAIQAKLDTLSAGYADTAAAAAAAAQATANDAAAAASSANSVISDITNDNKFTPDEKSAVRREWEIIAAEKLVNDAQADAFGVSKTVYGTKFQALANYLNNGTTWSSGIPSWISGALMAITTNVDGPTFRLKFKEYYDARTGLLNAIAAKAKQLADAAQDSVDNLEIGGRNLFPRTDFGTLVNKYYPSGQPSIYTLSVDNGALKIVGTDPGNGDDALKRVTAVQVGNNTDELHTISFEAYADVAVNLSFRPHYGTLAANGGTVAIGTTRTKYKVTFLNKYYYSGGIQGVGFFLWLSAAATVYISKLKLEKGSKPTDWTPAPEDVQAGIDAANAAIAAIADDGQFTPNEKQLVRREWENIVGQYSSWGVQGENLGLSVDVQDMVAEFQALANYLNNGVAWTSGVPLWISDSQLAVTTTVDPATFRLKFTNFYSALNILITEIGIATKVNVDAAQALAASNNYLKEALKNNTTVEGGLLSTTLIKLGAVNQSGSWVEKAGINGAGTTDKTPRIYAGGTLQQAINRIAGQRTNAAKFVVTQGGKIFGMEAELYGSFSTAPPGGKRIHLSQEAGAVNIHDDNGDVKTTITSEAIPSLSSLLATNSTSVDATKSILLTKSNGSDSSTQYSATLTLPDTGSNYKITTPPISCVCTAQENSSGEPGIDVGAMAQVSAYLVKPDSNKILLGAVGAYVDEPLGYDNQSATIPATIFEGMPSGNYKIELIAVVDAANIYGSAQASISIASPNNTLSGVSVVEVSRILRNGLFLIQDANNYAYLNPAGIKEKSQVAPDRPGVLLSGRGSSNGGATALWGPKKHATQTVVKASAGTYTVYHSIGHTNYSVQITSMVAQRTVRWDNILTDRFTVYIYSGSTLTDTNFSFAVFGDN